MILYQVSRSATAVVFTSSFWCLTVDKAAQLIGFLFLKTASAVANISGERMYTNFWEGFCHFVKTLYVLLHSEGVAA